MIQPVPTNFSTASQGSCHVHSTPCWNLPTSLCPAFFARQNLSSKRIAPTDNMRTKSDDAKWRHQWLKDKKRVKKGLSDWNNINKLASIFLKSYLLWTLASAHRYQSQTVVLDKFGENRYRECDGNKLRYETFYSCSTLLREPGSSPNIFVIFSWPFSFATSLGVFWWRERNIHSNRQTNQVIHIDIFASKMIIDQESVNYTFHNTKGVISWREIKKYESTTSFKQVSLYNWYS